MLAMPMRAVAGMVFHVRVEGDALAVVRPSGTPSFEVPFRNLDCFSAGRGHHVDMVPAILIAEEGNPFAVWGTAKAALLLRPSRECSRILFRLFHESLAWNPVAASTR